MEKVLKDLAKLFFRTVPTGIHVIPQSTSSTPPVPVHSMVTGKQSASDHAQLLGLNTSV